MTVDSLEQIRNRYNKSAKRYDQGEGILGFLGLNRLRRRLISQAKGKVLELAIGTERLPDLLERRPYVSLEAGTTCSAYSCI